MKNFCQHNKILMDFHVVKMLISNWNIDRIEHSEFWYYADNWHALSGTIIKSFRITIRSWGFQPYILSFNRRHIGNSSGGDDSVYVEIYQKQYLIDCSVGLIFWIDLKIITEMHIWKWQSQTLEYLMKDCRFG